MYDSYVDYLKNEGISKQQAQVASMAEFTEQLLQARKNESAPQISGSGFSGGSSSSKRSKISGGGGGGSYSGPLNFKGLGGGKRLPTGARVSQGWGKSRIKYAAGRHTGIDFGGAANSRISAAAGGIVTRAGREGAYGNAIHVRHADGTTALYAHLNGINVKPGQKVKLGQNIGRMGSTGRSTGTHLHFEIRKQDRYGGDVNPYSWFKTR